MSDFAAFLTLLRRYRRNLESRLREQGSRTMKYDEVD